jgi:hypothetical protein
MSLVCSFLGVKIHCSDEHKKKSLYSSDYQNFGINAIYDFYIVEVYYFFIMKPNFDLTFCSGISLNKQDNHIAGCNFGGTVVSMKCSDIYHAAQLFHP